MIDSRAPDLTERPFASSVSVADTPCERLNRLNLTPAERTR